MMDLVSALDHIEIGQKPDFFFAARTLLVHEREDLPLFDEAFELFWRKPAESWDIECQGLTRRRRSTKPIVMPPPLKDELPSANDSDSASQQPMTVVEVTRTYSAREILRHKD